MCPGPSQAKRVFVRNTQVPLPRDCPHYTRSHSIQLPVPQRLHSRIQQSLAKGFQIAPKLHLHPLTTNGQPRHRHLRCSRQQKSLNHFALPARAKLMWANQQRKLLHLVARHRANFLLLRRFESLLHIFELPQTGRLR